MSVIGFKITGNVTVCFNNFFKLTSDKTSKLSITDDPLIPLTKATYVENTSMTSHHHVLFVDSCDVFYQFL